MSKYGGSGLKTETGGAIFLKEGSEEYLDGAMRLLGDISDKDSQDGRIRVSPVKNALLTSCLTEFVGQAVVLVDEDNTVCGCGFVSLPDGHQILFSEACDAQIYEAIKLGIAEHLRLTRAGKLLHAIRILQFRLMQDLEAAGTKIKLAFLVVGDNESQVDLLLELQCERFDIEAHPEDELSKLAMARNEKHKLDGKRKAKVFLAGDASVRQAIKTVFELLRAKVLVRQLREDEGANGSKTWRLFLTQFPLFADQTMFERVIVLAEDLDVRVPSSVRRLDLDVAG